MYFMAGVCFTHQCRELNITMMRSTEIVSDVSYPLIMVHSLCQTYFFLFLCLYMFRKSRAGDEP